MAVDSRFDFDDVLHDEPVPAKPARRQRSAGLSQITLLVSGILVVISLIGGLLFYQHIRAENQRRYVELHREVDRLIDIAAETERGRRGPVTQKAIDLAEQAERLWPR
jgi:hypothetical protein